MSWQATQAVFGRSDATGGARMVLAYLAERACPDGLCWPSNAAIAEGCRLSIRQVQRARRRLVEMGELEIVQLGGGRQKTVVCRITLVENGDINGDIKGVIKGDVSVTVSQERVTNPTIKGDKSGTERVTPVSPEPPLTTKNHQERAGVLLSDDIVARRRVSHIAEEDWTELYQALLGELHPRDQNLTGPHHASVAASSEAIALILERANGRDLHQVQPDVPAKQGPAATSGGQTQFWRAADRPL